MTSDGVRVLFHQSLIAFRSVTVMEVIAVMECNRG